MASGRAGVAYIDILTYADEEWRQGGRRQAGAGGAFPCLCGRKRELAATTAGAGCRIASTGQAAIFWRPVAAAVDIILQHFIAIVGGSGSFRHTVHERG